MYVSKYYTCEEIDQRLLQGYYDDFVRAGFGGTINEFWAFVLSIKDKVDKKEGYGLSENDFTNELKAKLDGIEEHANYITKVSQLENDLKFQTDEDVKKVISDLVDGADDALDTLKELAEALGNDPNFATTITNKLTELRTALTEEINRAKEAEAALGAAVAAVEQNLEYAIEQIINKIDTVKSDLKAEIDRVEKKVDKNAEDIKNLEDKVNEKNDQLEDELKGLIQQEKNERIAADNEIKESVNELKTLHINDKAEVLSKIAEEVSNRTNSDTILDSKINEEITNRQSDTVSLQGKIDKEAVDRYSADQVIHNEISKEVTDRTNADNALQGNIDKEIQARTSADQVLQNNINAEATSRAAQDIVLEHRIDDIESTEASNKEQLLEAIATEKADRIAADEVLDEKKVDKREGYSLTKNDFTDILKAKLDGIEEKANYITHLSQLINDSDYQTEEEVNALIQKIIGSAPEVLDTLEEIAKALGDDPNFASTITKKLAAITEQVNQEIEDRIAGDEANSAEVATEVQSRKDADTALEAKLKEYIDNKSDDSDTALGVVRDNLNKEIQDRKDADAVIQASLDKEVADRKKADEAFTTSIGNINKRISDLALSIQETINTVRNELTEKVNANTAAIEVNKHNIERNSEAITNLNKSVSDNYKEIKDMINEEIVDRTNADSSLGSRIDTLNIDLNTERTERIAADQVLQVNLDKEVADRTNADTALKTEMTSKLDNTKQALESEIDKLNTKLDQEKTDRTNADTALGARIDSLDASNTTAITKLEEKVKSNTTAINTEKERAIAKENSIEAKVDTNLQNHKDDMASVNQGMLTEKNERLAGDTLLQNNIDKEATERANQDTLINNALAQEKSDRIAADEVLDEKKVDKVDGKVLSSNDFTDILYAKLDGIEEKANYITKVSQLLNDSDYQTEEEVNEAIQRVIGSAPEVLDTLAEIAKALGDDPNFAATITAKLTELENKLTAEKNLREQGDNTLQQSFTNLSTTLNTTVDTLRDFVNETRTELLTSLNATNALVTQNAANIQRNLELIQGIQTNINGNYTAITDLLNNEIAARKAEDIRLEAKIDQNTSNLNTEREERKAADKVLQDNIDAEEAARIAADTALGKRIDKEIQDRTDADTALDNKFTGVTDDHEERLVAEEATSDALPKTLVTRVGTVERDNSNISLVVHTSTKDDSNNQYAKPTPNTKSFPAATQSLAGVMTAADKVKLDGLDENALIDISADSDADKVTVTVTKDNGLNADTTETFDLPQVSSDKAGIMTAKDKVELDRIITANFALGDVTPNETSVGIAASKTVIEDGTIEQNPITIPASTAEKAGVQSAADKKLFDSLPKRLLSRISGYNYLGDRLGIYYKEFEFNPKSGEFEDTAGSLAGFEELILKAVTKTTAGVMTAKDKVNLDETLPQAISQEAQAREDADTTLETKLQTNIDALESKHDDFVAMKGKANGFAPLDENALIPANHLPSYVDDAIEVYATYDISPTGGLTNIQLYSDADHQTPIVGESGKIYINITDDEPAYQFRWSGERFVDINTSSLIIGEIAGTAFEGNRGKDLENFRDNLFKTSQGTSEVYFISNVVDSPDGNNTVLKVIPGTDPTLNLRLYFAKRTLRRDGSFGGGWEYQTIPAVTKTTAGVMTAQDKVNLDETLPQAIENEVTNRTNAINDLRVELKTYVDDLVANTGSDLTALEAVVNTHLTDRANPHLVTKVQVGLGNVNNTSDADKPVSTAQAASIADAKAAGTAAQSSIDSHAGRKDNPHTVTRGQLGLDTTDQVVFAKTTAPSGFWKESSDIRLKSNLKDLNHTLEQICQIPTKSFNMNGKEDEGTIAQNLEALGFGKYVDEAPVEKSKVDNPEDFETIEINGEEYVLVKQVKYHKMSTLAIEGIKLLYDEIKTLKAEIQELKSE